MSKISESTHCCPHPDLPPTQSGEGVYVPSPGFAGGGSGWGRL